MNTNEARTMPDFKKPIHYVSTEKFMELVARVEALEKALEEKRGRKPKDE